MSKVNKMELSAEEKVFLKEVEADLDDDLARLVYADWLEERGDPRGEYLRLEYELISGDGTTEELSVVVERINQLNQTIAPDWLALVSRAAIEGCNSNYLDTRKCVGRWRKLQKTDQPTIRLCHECRNAVHFCTSLNVASSTVGYQQSRVALETTLERSKGDLPSGGRQREIEDQFCVYQPAQMPWENEEVVERLATAENMIIATFGNRPERRRNLWQRMWDE